MAKPLVKTRANLLCPLFGSAKDILPEENQLPTYKDLMKCYLSVRIELKESCSCEKKRKVPKAEWSFLQDQRSYRKMKIGEVDKIVTKQIQKREERKFGHKRSAEEKEPILSTSGIQNKTKEKEPIPSTSGIQNKSKMSQIDMDTCNNSSTESFSDTDEEYKCPFLVKQRRIVTPKFQQMRCSLTQTAKMGDLTDTSYRAVAKIVNSVLEDFNIISKDDQSDVIDKSKISRELSKNR
ncbi:unnamed protein product [Psylliodes chrysocephalus]|uniref:Uncharacterized protein n=1 Tax=Psylliodes chrysocephalus TaxID=3402493 RepID=A0A9P0CJ30_9CUCU|nr:unnamed protein product [Psylliodes chrysocephala]